MAFTQQLHLNSTSGAILNVYTRKAKGRSRGVIHINHGIAEHAARYGRFADTLAAHGFHTYAHDHRGHGYTTAPDAPLGVFGLKNGAIKVLEDISNVHDLIHREHPTLPLIIFGHSMGGIITTNYIIHHSSHLAGAAIWNANLSAGALAWLARAILAYEQFRRGSDQPSHILPRLTFQAWGKAVPNHRTMFDWLSRDPLEVDKYVADPLCGWDATVSLWKDLFRYIFTGADNSQFANIARRMPINLVGGESDPATDGGKAVMDMASRLNSMGFTNVSATNYAETRHESLNEINRDQITTAFIEWATSVVSGRERKKTA